MQRNCGHRLTTLGACLLAALLVITIGAEPAAVPDEARRRNNLGVALMDAGAKDPKYFQEATREFEAAIRLAPQYPVARVNYGLALYYAGQSSRADAVLREAASADPLDPRAQYVLGLIRESEGAFEAAAVHFERVAARDAHDADAWYHLGFCLGKAGRAREAPEPLRRAAAIVPYQRRVRYALYMTLSRAGRTEEARQELEKFRALDNAQIRVVEGPKNTMEYLKQGRYAEAIADSREVSPLPPAARYADGTSAAGLSLALPRVEPDVGAVLRGDPFVPSRLTPSSRRGLARALAASAATADFDNDGRLDLALVVRSQLRIYRQGPGGRFLREPLPPAVANASFAAVAWGDLDNDGWADLVAAGPGRVLILQNQRARFRLAPGGPGRAVPAWCVPAGLTLADVDHDGDLDLMVAGGVDLDRPLHGGLARYPADFAPRPNVLLRNNGDGSFVDVAREAGLQGVPVGTRGAYFADLDDDHAVDAVLVDMRGIARAFVNRKDGTFAPGPDLRVPAVHVPIDEASIEGDMDGDGAIDRVIVSSTGVRVERNLTRPARWLTVRVAGYAVPGKVKSNALGIGTRIEVRSAGRWERRDIRGGNAAGGSDAPEVTFDLGQDARLDFVRAVFPSGVRKTLRDVSANQAIRIDEPLLDVNSCPTVFTWDGRRFRFIADTISAGILGELVAPGEYWSPDPDEWLRIDGEALAPRKDGRLDIRFTNPLEEVTYLDQVRLLAVDHPSGVEVYTDDRMLGARRETPVSLFVLNRERPVARATDRLGREVTDTLRAVDRQYVEDFAARPFKGFAGDWTLELDLGALSSTRRTALGLYGWSYWNSSASIVAAAQAGETLWGPILEVLAANGRWRVATADLGLPAGLPRPMVVDLAPYLRPGEHVIRIRGNRTIYYDRAWVADVVASAPIGGIGTGDALGLRAAEAPLAGAELRWIGYPRRTLPDGRLPEVFDYDTRDRDTDWQTPAGTLTRYGDVSSLVRLRDDRFAVMGHGEEVSLAFDGRRLRPPAPGWQRVWLLFSDGYEKGSELYSARGDTVGPLPWHGMPAYPETGARPFDLDYTQYLVDWNTRPAFLRGPR